MKQFRADLHIHSRFSRATSKKLTPRHLDIDMWKEVAKRMNLDYEFQPMDFNGIIPGLQAGSVDAAVAGITIKPSRAEVVDFSDGYYDSGLVILVRSDNNDIKTINDLKDKIVG